MRSWIPFETREGGHRSSRPASITRIEPPTRAPQAAALERRPRSASITRARSKRTLRLPIRTIASAGIRPSPIIALDRPIRLDREHGAELRLRDDPHRLGRSSVRRRSGRQCVVGVESASASERPAPIPRAPGREASDVDRRSRVGLPANEELHEPDGNAQRRRDTIAKVGAHVLPSRSNMREHGAMDPDADRQRVPRRESGVQERLRQRARSTHETSRELRASSVVFALLRCLAEPLHGTSRFVLTPASAGCASRPGLRTAANVEPSAGPSGLHCVLRVVSTTHDAAGASAQVGATHPCDFGFPIFTSRSPRALASARLVLAGTLFGSTTSSHHEFFGRS